MNEFMAEIDKLDPVQVFCACLGIALVVFGMSPKSGN